MGIDNDKTYRYDEYSPWYREIGGQYLPHARATGYLGGHGFLYLEFLATTLKTYIDTHYKTLVTPEMTGLMGSSMGGLISLCGALEYPHVFGKVGALFCTS